MPTDISKVVRLAQQHIRTLNLERSKSNQNIDYQEPKEGLLNLHIEWEELMLCSRSKGIPAATRVAVGLAAAALKFAADLATEEELGLKYVPPVKTLKQRARISFADDDTSLPGEETTSVKSRAKPRSNKCKTKATK